MADTRWIGANGPGSIAVAEPLPFSFTFFRILNILCVLRYCIDARTTQYYLPSLATTICLICTCTYCTSLMYWCAKFSEQNISKVTIFRTIFVQLTIYTKVQRLDESYTNTRIRKKNESQKRNTKRRKKERNDDEKKYSRIEEEVEWIKANEISIIVQTKKKDRRNKSYSTDKIQAKFSLNSIFQITKQKRKEKRKIARIRAYGSDFWSVTFFCWIVF